MIVIAAVKKGPMVCVGKRHNNIRDSMTGMGINFKEPDVVQGFLNSDGKFLDRLEAAEEALRCGQISELKWPPNLYSEDLY